MVFREFGYWGLNLGGCHLQGVYLNSCTISPAQMLLLLLVSPFCLLQISFVASVLISQDRRLGYLFCVSDVLIVCVFILNGFKKSFLFFSSDFFFDPTVSLVFFIFFPFFLMYNIYLFCISVCDQS